MSYQHDETGEMCVLPSVYRNRERRSNSLPVFLCIHFWAFHSSTT